MAVGAVGGGEVRVLTLGRIREEGM